ncbi:AI-2E family transporter [Desulfurobacterium sp.]|uniref:AI-2E family transporter n=1 Tax=Desulfurobacterium sp. TaxID=2004706 RepID=UPI00262755D7|nr:AI-2E family transporter [Desulfurobacterium sp.]
MNNSVVERYFPEIVVTLTITVFIIVLFMMKPVVFPFFAAMASAYISFPVFEFFLKIFKKRQIAALLTVVLILLAILSLMLVVLPDLIKQIEEFIDYLPVLTSKIDFHLSKYIGKRVFANGFNPKNATTVFSLLYKNFSVNNSLTVAALAQKIFSGVFSIASVVINIVVIPLLSYYILVDWENLRDLYLKLIPRAYRTETAVLLDRVNDSLSGYIRGQLLMAFLVAVYFSITLTVVDIRYSFLIAVVTGIMNMIPYVGFFTGFVPSILLAVFDNGDLFHIVAVIIVFLSEVALENVIYPMVMSRTTGINPLLIIFAIFFGATYGSFLGIIVAVPVVAMILPVFDSFMMKRESE